jgi:hypothetical protein
MAKEKEKQTPPELPRDDREIDARAILRYAAMLAGAMAVVLALTWSFAGYLGEAEERTHAAPPPMARERPTSPPNPKLQPQPREGLEALRADEQRDLTGYSWINAERRIVRIPVERAMDILAERGLPTRDMGPPAIAPVSLPTDSSLTPPREGGR